LAEEGERVSTECLFCRIIAGDEEAEFVAQEDEVVAFEDKFPRAPVHVLVVSREHIPSAHDLTDEHTGLLGRCFALAHDIAEKKGTSNGYRIATNIGSRGGQAIPHLHFHVLGGRQLGFIDSEGPPQ
jgi:histidine triad (HIT) family protein